MERAEQKRRAEAFLALHRGPRILVLGSVWDVASAVVFEHAGFVALGTSSAGIAYVHGRPDDEGLPRAAMVEAVRAIAARVSIPVSADMLTGYGDTPEAVAETCRLVLDAGAIGVNLEDSAPDGSAALSDRSLQRAKIRAVRAMAEEYGVPLVVNARTDSYWLKLGDDASRLRDSIDRANAYREAGADCLFVPGALDAATIRTLVREIAGPVNILAMPGCPPVAELESLGVRRVSEGSGPARAALKTAQTIAQELLERGTYSAYHDAAVSYPDANRLFER
ncbi:MAG TPA: isocitrate lyase/phosphoenolpyruvate mutase family protein [Burkholderiales bacterium]|nr:isocitrate lyase/phosphoenolpyruvate mutase family protein [Burkholderiales bacterium]